MNAQARKEECRQEVLGFLVNRQALAHEATAIRRRLNRDGFDFTSEEVENALQFLTGLELVQILPHQLGATKFFQTTSKGILHHERNQ